MAELSLLGTAKKDIMTEDPAALTRSMGSDVETKSADAQLAEDIHLLDTYDVMRSKYRERIDGNCLLTAEREKAARLIALGSEIAGEDRKKLADIYDNLYRIEALKAMLCVEHPHHLNEIMSKGEVIQAIINAVLGLPTMQEWIDIMQKYDELRHREDKSGDESNEDNQDLSKAGIHSKSTAPTKKGLKVVKKPKNVSNRKDNKTTAGDKGKHQGSNKDKSKGKDKDKDKDKDKGTSGDKAKGKDKSTQEAKTDDVSSKDGDGNNTTSALVVGGDPPMGRNVAPLQLGPALPPRMVATGRAA